MLAINVTLSFVENRSAQPNEDLAQQQLASFRFDAGNTGSIR